MIHKVMQLLNQKGITFFTKNLERQLNLKPMFTLMLFLAFNPIIAQEEHAMDSLKQLLAKSYPVSKKVEVLNKIARGYRLNDLDSMEVYVKKILDLSVEENYEKGIYIAHKEHGQLYYHRYEFDKAISYFKKSIDGFLKINDKENAAAAYNVMAGCYFFSSEVATSIVTMNKALKLAYEINDELKICDYLGNLTIIYFGFEDYHQVQNLFKERESLGFCSPNKLQFQNLALVQLKLGDTQNALYNADKLKELVTNNKDTSGLAQSHLLYGKIYLEQGHLKKALKNFKKTIDLYNQGWQFELPQLLSAYKNKTLIYIKKNQLDSALISAKRAQEISKKSKTTDYLYSNSKLLYDIYIAQGQTNRALTYGDLALRYSDSIIDKDKLKKSYEQMIVLEQSLAEQKKTNKINLNKQKNLGKILLLVLLFGSISVFIFVFKNHKLKKTKIRIESEIDKKILLSKKLNTIETSIASDLHDNIGNRLSGLYSSLDMLKDMMEKTNSLNDENTSKQFNRLQNELETHIDVVRDLLWSSVIPPEN